VTALISILLLTFFLLLDNDRFIAAGLTLFHPAQRPRLRRLLGRSAAAIHGYVNGNLAISLIAGVAAYVVMTVLGMPYAVALALVVALFDLIPLIGGTLGAAVVVLVALFVNPITAGIQAAFFLIYQQVENNVLQPMVYGRSVSLHPLVIFVAVLAGGQLRLGGAQGRLLGRLTCSPRDRGPGPSDAQRAHGRAREQGTAAGARTHRRSTPPARDRGRHLHPVFAHGPDRPAQRAAPRRSCRPGPETLIAVFHAQHASTLPLCTRLGATAKDHRYGHYHGSWTFPFVGGTGEDERRPRGRLGSFGPVLVGPHGGG